MQRLGHALTIIPRTFASSAPFQRVTLFSPPRNPQTVHHALLRDRRCLPGLGRCRFGAVCPPVYLPLDVVRGAGSTQERLGFAQGLHLRQLQWPAPGLRHEPRPGHEMGLVRVRAL